MERNEIKKLLDAYVDKQAKSYEKTGNFNRCFHRFQGYLACLVDMGIMDKDERDEFLSYMADKLENVIYVI